MSVVPETNTVVPAGLRVLGLDEDELVACVACGLCLPHCPTYRVTGLEAASPRGRIAAMLAVELRGAPIDATFTRVIDECVQCRGCEAACPSSVPFGRLMEGTRAALGAMPADRLPRRKPLLRRMGEWFAYHVVLARHGVLIALTWLAWLGQRLHLVPARAGLPPLRARELASRLDIPAGGQPDAWLFTGCVMDAWMRDAHRAAATVLTASGLSCARPGRGGDCCGALHVHAGRIDDARRLAKRVIASMPGDAPIVVDSAGCGAAMKDYEHLLGTPEAERFAGRVRDFSEAVAERGPLPVVATGRRVVVQDPCHLRHVQRAHGAVRTVLEGAYELRETDDDGLCCGAGGAYALWQPELANAIRDRKVDALRRAGLDERGTVVASANPGCLMHLRGAGVDAVHPAVLLAAALSDGKPGRD
ncbi:MAG: glycolate oxidase iron-sulfur subunit [Actinomycetota bacterium]|nr:glycolate oxidase iron-sulfur subunit [Actinomycetota bacterium]